MAHAWPVARADAAGATASVGGTELYAAALHDAMRARGLRVGRFTPAEVVGRRSRHGLAAHVSDPVVETAFERALGVLRPDVVHVHHLSGLGLSLPTVARRSGARVVVTLHDDWLNCARGQRVDLDLARCEGPDPRRCARCLAPDLWAPLPPTLARRLPPRTSRVRARRDAFDAAARATDLFLAPSPHFTDRLGVPAEHLPLPLLRPIRPAPPREEGPLRVLFLGSWIPTKGPHVAVEAFTRLPAGTATLTLAGPAPDWRGRSTYARALVARVRALRGVELRGAVAPEAVEALLHSHDVLVFPSTWDENAPLVLREAAAAGVRVVASDVPGARAHAPHARLVPPNDAQALADALATLSRAPRARDPVVDAPALDAHVDALLARYRALVG